jgi:hypothetical protein
MRSRRRRPGARLTTWARLGRWNCCAICFGLIGLALISLVWSEWRSLLQGGGTAGARTHLARCTLSPRGLLVRSGSDSLLGDLVARTLIMLRWCAPRTFLQRGRPGGVYAGLAAFASTSLALGALRTFLQRGRTGDPVLRL